MDDLDIQDMESSAVSDQDAPQTDEVMDAAADSSPAEGVTPEADTLSLIRDVVGEKASDGAVSPAGTAEDDGREAGARLSHKEPDDENFSDVPFHKHPRFQQLLRRTKSAEVDAGRYRNVETFLQNNALSADEAANALVIAGLSKTNPAEAWRQVQPWVKQLLVAAGEILPDDLAQRVSRNELAQDAAVEMSRLRAMHQSQHVSQQFAEHRRREAEDMQAQAARIDAASQWEADRRIKDPNFAAKESLIQREVAYLQRQEGVPVSAAGVRDMLQRAYTAVNERFRAPAPQASAPRQRPAITPVRGGQVNGSGSTPNPQSTLDIVRAHRRTT